VKSNRFVIAILFGILLILLLIIYSGKSIGYGMGDNALKYSNGIDESKKNGMFLGYYKPLQDSLILGDLTFKTEDIWYEKNWTTKHDFLFRKSIEVDSGIHFIAPYHSLLSSDLKVDICLLQYSPTCPNGCFVCTDKQPELGYTHTILTQPDTLVLLFGTEYCFGDKDTITYLRE